MMKPFFSVQYCEQGKHCIRNQLTLNNAKCSFSGSVVRTLLILCLACSNKPFNSSQKISCLQSRTMQYINVHRPGIKNDIINHKFYFLQLVIVNIITDHMEGFDLHSRSFCCLVYISVPSFAFLFLFFRQRINPATSVLTLVPALRLNYGYRCPVAQRALSLMNRENVEEAKLLRCRL